jgi:hypothetical protein
MTNEWNNALEAELVTAIQSVKWAKGIGGNGGVSLRDRVDDFGIRRGWREALRLLGLDR